MKHLNIEIRHEGSAQLGNSLAKNVARSAGPLCGALSGLLRSAGEKKSVATQLGTAVSLLEQRIGVEGPIGTADHVGGWLRLVTMQHPQIFAEFPFNEHVLCPVLDSWRTALSEGLSPAEHKDLNALIERLRFLLGQRSSATVKALFIGDCLIWDVATQVQIHAHKQSFDVEPTLVAKRVGADLRRSLKDFLPDQFDLIFYSPFSFAFSEEYARFTAPRKMLDAIVKGGAPLYEAAEDAQKTIELLYHHFESPLYVHTVSGIRQNNLGWRGGLVNLITRPTRRWARAQLNRRLSSFVAGLAAGGKRPIRRINEAEPLNRMTDRELGQVMYNAGELHPTTLAQELALGPYTQACMVVAQFKKRKLIVCDLDNTLWDGVIGDGPVVQHAYRQLALLRLKGKGVVLAVSSKNDPTNVRWEEAVVSPSDFVAMEINWSRKANNIRKIANTLNLNPNSFVFLDDRPDEREIVKEELPGILTLDPNDPKTWELIDEWTDALSGVALKDRTTIYQDRIARHSYIESQQDLEDDVAEAYRKLDLQLTLRYAENDDMERVVELINRTNQFNTTVSRITMTELNQPEPHRRIVLGEARDKFGDMGIIGILVVTDDGQPWITHFVLSCRVFGFGIENAMVQSVLHSFPGQTLMAELVKTPVNGPCQEVYAANGFIHDGCTWISQGPLPDAVPDWLAVDDQCSVSTTSQGAA